MSVPRLPEDRQIAADTGQERRVGVEIEFAGLKAEDIVGALKSLFGGTVEQDTLLVYRVIGTAFGDFVVELDASYLKQLAERLKQNPDPAWSGYVSPEVLADAAAQLVPWEVVAPPIPFSKVDQLDRLIARLREQGALGTRHTLHFAFGVHLNPELPDLNVSTIVNYLRAYFCLYDWIVREDDTDLIRRITPYINHFDKEYILKVIDWAYQPSIEELIDDYLDANPSRNRSMDMLPLFAYIDEARVRRRVADPRVNARPTLHYRLPNCDIDNPAWSLQSPWQLWLQVEALAANEQRLHQACKAYQKHLLGLLPNVINPWADKVDDWLILND